MNDILQKLMDSDANVIIFDIDGTLKDLCEEHTLALYLATNKLVNKKRLRKKIVYVINTAVMQLVKCGAFPTNYILQKILLVGYAILLGISIKEFKKQYYLYYDRECILFEGVDDLLRNVVKDKQIFFATINKQNYNLEEYGIPQEKIIYATTVFKRKTYEAIIIAYGFEKDKVIIVGDNVFDDMVSAKALGVDHILVNNYNSKLKGFICKIFGHGSL